MNIIYVLTIITIYILFILIHKTNKKQNILLWSNITVILILCYNVLICLIYSVLGILCTIKNLSISNIMTIILLSIILLKTKKIQKYYTKMVDIFFTIVVLILTIFIAYRQYGIPFNIKYSSTDASTHYFFAEQFYEKSSLLYKGNDDFLGIHKSEFRLPGAYVNEGILFKIFDNILLKTDVFILFELSMLYLSGTLFYHLLMSYKQSKKNNALAVIFSIIYMLGYPLNSMLVGAKYLSLGLNLIIVLLILISNREKQEIDEKLWLPIISLVSFGIFFSYAYFIPIIYISIIIYLIIKSKKSKIKIFNVNNVITITYVIVIPLILGISYFIIFPIINGMNTEISTINVDGYIYKNYITNYLIFIFIYIISFIKKEKNQEYGAMLFKISIIFSLVLFIGNKLTIVSSYYFFKSYYIIWLLAIYTTYMIICNSKDEKLMTRIIYTYAVFVLIFTFVLKKNIKINDIIYSNFNEIESQNYAIERKELEILRYAKNQDIDQDLYILPSDYLQVRDFWLMTLYGNQYIYIDMLTGYQADIERWLKEENQRYYLAYYKESGKIELDKSSNKYKIIYQDDYGYILEKIK